MVNFDMNDYFDVTYDLIWYTLWHELWFSMKCDLCETWSTYEIWFFFMESTFDMKYEFDMDDKTLYFSKYFDMKLY